MKSLSLQVLNCLLLRCFIQNFAVGSHDKLIKYSLQIFFFKYMPTIRFSMFQMNAETLSMQMQELTRTKHLSLSCAVCMDSAASNEFFVTLPFFSFLFIMIYFFLPSHFLCFILDIQVFLASCTLVQICYGSLLPSVVFPNYKLCRFPHGESLSSLYIYSVRVCVSVSKLCVCSSLLAQMLGCVQCVNLGLVGLLRHDLDYVGPCLLSASSSVPLLSSDQPASQTRIQVILTPPVSTVRLLTWL